MQDTPLRELVVAPTGVGVGRMVHVVPFHVSANVQLVVPISLAFVVEKPTAVHAVVDVQDTPVRELLVAPVTLGVVCAVQVVPFHTSANVRPVLLVFVEEPTAVHAVVDVQDTPVRELLVAPAGAGVGRMVQVVPFHDSTSCIGLLGTVKYRPTAVQAVADVQDTPLRELLVAPAGLGVVWMVQVVPFHTSTNVLLVLLVFV